MPQPTGRCFTQGIAREAAMPEDVKSSVDSGDDLNVLAGVVALVSLALMATALWT